MDVEWHDMRWGIESWYRGPGRRGLGLSPDPAGHALCMAYSLLMPRAYAVAMVMAALDAVASRTAIRRARITHSEF